MKKYQNPKNPTYSTRIHKFFIAFTFAILGFALPSICPVPAKAASADFSVGFEIKNRQTPAIGTIFDRTVEKNGVRQTGYLEICKEISGTGLDNNIFRFKIGGLTVQVLPGQCSGPIAVEAGQYVVEELIDGNTQTGGIFNGGFLMTGVRTLGQTPASVITAFDLQRRTATVNISEGDISNQTRIVFTNTFAAKAYVVICNRVLDANGATNASTYTIDSLPNTFSVSAGACSAPILVYIPSAPDATSATGTVRVTQRSGLFMTLESAPTIPPDRFNSLTLGSGIKNVVNINCANVADPVTAGCTFDNPRGGFVDIDVIGGDVTAATTVEFFNRGETIYSLKICKIAGPGVAVGTFFTVDIVVNGDPEAIVTPQTLPAGDASGGGSCNIVQVRYGDTISTSSFRPNSNVTVTERATTGLFVSAISSPSGGNPIVNPANRTAIMTLSAGVSELAFTNASTTAPAPTPTPVPVSFLKICKIAGFGVTPFTLFTFDVVVNGEPETVVQPIQVPAGLSSQGGICQQLPNSFSPAANVTVTERATTGFLVSAVSSPSGGVPTVNLTDRKATMTLGVGVNELAFTNASTAPVSVATSTGTNVSVAPTTSLNVTFSNISAAGNTTVSVIPPEQQPSLPSGFAVAGSAPVYEITTSAVFSDNIVISFDVPNVADAGTCSRLRILHYINNAWDSSNNAAPRYNAATRICTVSQTVTSLSPFAVAQILAPTAAEVSVGGQVVNSKRRGIAGAIVTMTDSSGNIRTTTTTSLGYYVFDAVPAGETYIISVRSKHYSFVQSSRILNSNEDTNDFDFIGHSTRFLR